jgi:AcrR family transcriptional regulator
MAGLTRERLMLAAERLFAERGIAGVSLREIGIAAGQRNNSAAQYHFDTKQGLIDAICELRMRPINERRLALVRQIEQEQRTRDLRVLIEALVHPLTESIHAGSHYARFQAQLWMEAAHDRLMAFELKEMEGMRRLTSWAEECIADIPQPLRTQRMVVTWRFILVALAEYERELETGNIGVTPTAARIANLVDMMVAMVTAPISPSTLRELQASQQRA